MVNELERSQRARATHVQLSANIFLYLSAECNGDDTEQKVHATGKQQNRNSARHLSHFSRDKVLVDSQDA